jgi:type I restriction enzyme S subunit
MKWPTAPLGDLCNVISGGTPKRSVNEYWNGDIPWVKISDMLQGEITSTDECITELGLKESPARLLEPGTLLLSIFATVGRTAILAIPATTNQAIVGLQLKTDALNCAYLHHFLDSQTAALKQKSRGVAQDNINTSILKQLQIPLPPLEEQRRIAAILDKHSSIEKDLLAAREKYDSFLASSFLDIFGDPVNNPMGWETRSMSESLTLVNGRAFKASEWSTRGLPIIRIANVRRADEPYNYFDGRWEPKHLVRLGDILLCWAGQLVSIGVHRWDREDGLLNQHIFKVIPRFEADPDFVAFSLDRVIKRAKSNFRGIEMKHLTKEGLANEKIIIPPMATQLRFGEIAREAQKLRLMSEARLLHTKHLRESIATQYFLPRPEETIPQNANSSNAGY